MAATEGTAEVAGAGRAAAALVAVLVTAACAVGTRGGASSGGRASDSGSATDSARRRPVVEVPAVNGTLPFLDPDAEPTTALGRLRAQHLPVWTSDFDWAFPPDVCGSAWELDGIAEPTAAGDIAVLGDFATAAALTVMRYEHQLSRALADPTPLAQLCVALASVEPARSDALSVLESHLETGARRSEPAAYPEEVWIVGVGQWAAMAVACVDPGYPAVVGADGATIEASQSPLRLQAYLLTISAGREDQVADISYRVSDTSHRPAGDCSTLDAWRAEWDGHVQTWLAEGRIWVPLSTSVTVDGICDSPPPGGPDECPRDWPQ